MTHKKHSDTSWEEFEEGLSSAMKGIKKKSPFLLIFVILGGSLVIAGGGWYTFNLIEEYDPYKTKIFEYNNVLVDPKKDNSWKKSIDLDYDYLWNITTIIKLDNTTRYYDGIVIGGGLRVYSFNYRYGKYSNEKYSFNILSDWNHTLVPKPFIHREKVIMKSFSLDIVLNYSPIHGQLFNISFICKCWNVTAERYYL